MEGVSVYWKGCGYHHVHIGSPHWVIAVARGLLWTRDGIGLLYGSIDFPGRYSTCRRLPYAIGTIEGRLELLAIPDRWHTVLNYRPALLYGVVG